MTEAFRGRGEKTKNILEQIWLANENNPQHGRAHIPSEQCEVI